MSSTPTLPFHPVAVRPAWRRSPEGICEDTPTDDTRWQMTARDLHKTYRKGKLSIPVLRGVDFSIRRGGFTAIVGQSGSGKSTLLHLLATLDAPDAGEDPLRGTADRQPHAVVPRPLAQSQLRHDLPVLPPVAGADDARKRADAADDFRGGLGLLADVGGMYTKRATAAAGNGGAGAPSQAQAAGTLRRRNAAGRHRPGADCPAEAPAGRRADRQSRPANGPRDPRRSCDP